MHAARPLAQWSKLAAYSCIHTLGKVEEFYISSLYTDQYTQQEGEKTLRVDPTIWWQEIEIYG